ncbi:inactive phospholipase C-like protein 1 isoform X2 [Stegodyphus dumicola]|uniref:inactive phospholipase C-like protein 1 isoform X2 n=1 Tax=Stegodyphus dumicola TaxID=202533 RepID=UPI0015A8FDF1|nr:inactive phospholipase C-like protein 1 isoform X2 [Stegodyphus dumicola]
MSSEEIISNSTNKSALSGEVRKNGNCANVCEGTSPISVSNDKKESASDCDRKYSSSAPVGIKPVRKDLPNLPPISHQLTKSLNVKDDKNSLSEEDSSENLESLDWSCSGSRDDGMLQNQSQRPKSVSFHTGSSLPVERKISNALDCLRYMINGSSLIKVRPSARQYRRFFSLEEDLSALRWIPSSKKSSKAKILIRCMKEVRMGRTTDVLRSKEIAWTYSEDCAFSIIYNDNFESLDLIASSPDEANIWVTGLNVLIGASKSPDTFDERQKMREKWLKEVFEQADTSQRGLLSEGETISLMKKLNNQLSTVRLRQKIMEFEHGKQGEERGRIDSSDFVSIFKETSTRPEIYFLLVRFSGKDYMTLEDLHLFLEGEQGMVNVTTEECLKIIEQYEPSEEAKQNKQILIDGFTLFLLSDSCDIFDPFHKTVCQEMNHPFPHYFIATSHNTYLLEDQLKGPSSIEGYSTALKMGCRCVKVDCWDSIDGPVVYHGNTLTSKIPLHDVFETIQEFAFVTSPYPLIIHLENHCSLENQKQVSILTEKVFGDHLYVPGRDGHLKVSQMTPEHLKGKIIIKGKKLPPQCTEEFGDVSDEDEDQDCSNSKNVLRKIKLSRSLSDLVTLTRIRFWDIELTEEIQRLSDVSSFSEVMASKLSQFSAEDMVNHNKCFLTHVFPNSSRIDSSNYNPLEYWSCGCQLVAMNYQTAGHMMDLYQGWFQQNGNCGYTLKPSFLRDQLCLYSGGCAKDPLPGVEPTILYLKIISAQQLPQPKGASAKASSIDPYVVVQVYGMAIDCAEARTRTVSNEGHSPIFDESFEFTVTVPELALLRIAVLDDEFIGDDFIGQYTVPLTCLRTGYRHLRLLSNNGDPLYNTTLFIYITMTTRSEKQRSKRRKAWLNMKCVGIKQADDVFKNAESHLAEAYKMRVDEEQAMLDLCKECGVPDSANIVQCLRVLSLRMASCPAVTSWEITSINNQPSVKVCGELTPCLCKAVSLLEKVLIEYCYIKKTAHETLKVLSGLYKTGEAAWCEMMQNTSNLGSKGRKVEKVVENFLWNMTMLATQTDLLKVVYEQSCIALDQLNNLMGVFSKLFQKERESVIAANESNPAVTPVLTNQINLMPFSEQLPLTPTSPGDGRLRGILKKSTASAVPPPSATQPECNSGSSVFFPGHSNENSNR